MTSSLMYAIEWIAAKLNEALGAYLQHLLQVLNIWYRLHGMNGNASTPLGLPKPGMEKGLLHPP